MSDMKNSEKQATILTDEELNKAVGGVVNLVENSNKDMLGSSEPSKPIEQNAGFSQKLVN